MTAADLTKNEKDMVLAIVDSQYGDTDDVNKVIWSWDVCGSKSTAAVLGSLVKKGVAGQQVRGDDASCWLTDLGKSIYKELVDPYDIVTVKVNKHNLEDLLLVLYHGQKGSDNLNPLECIGARLFRHADGSEKDRLRLLDKMGLEMGLTPNGGKSIVMKKTQTQAGE